MFVNPISPILFEVGSLQIRYYGIIYALGFILGFLYLQYLIQKGKLPLSKAQLDDLILHLVLGTVLGSRFFYFVFYQPHIFWTNPLEIFYVWQGGLAFHGGLIGVSIAVYLYCKKHNTPFYTLADAIVAPAIFALALGRIGNFTNHELYGPITDVFWCVVFSTAEGCRHPYQLYASLSHFLLFGILLFVYFKQTKKGYAFWSFVTLYGLFRFITDFWRVEPALFGISMGQFLSLLMFLLGLYIPYRNAYKSSPSKKRS